MSFLHRKPCDHRRAWGVFDDNAICHGYVKVFCPGCNQIFTMKKKVA